MNEDQYRWTKREIARLSAQEVTPWWLYFFPGPFKMFVLEARYAAISNLVRILDAYIQLTSSNEKPPERDEGVTRMIVLCILRVRWAVDLCPRDVIATVKSYLFGLGRGGPDMYIRSLRDALRDLHELASDSNPNLRAIALRSLVRDKLQYSAAIDLLRRHHCTKEADVYEQFIASTTAASQTSTP